MARRAKYLATALGALAIAAPVLAQDVAPPADGSEQAVLNWARAAKLTDSTASPAANWSMMAALDEGILWNSIQAPPDAAGIAKVGVRLERFRPAGTARSEGMLYELDCKKNLVKATYDASFAEHNLSGAKQERPVNSAWEPVAGNELVSAFKDDACKATSATLAAAAPAAAATGAPAINIADPSAVRNWVAQNGIRDRGVGVRSDQWTVLRATPEGVLYTQLADRDSATQSATIAVRLERFTPAANAKIQTTMSEVQEFEFNCRQMRVRKRSTMFYVNHNLQGNNDGVAKIEDWTPIAQHPLLAAPGEQLCEEARGQQRGFQSRG